MSTKKLEEVLTRIAENPAAAADPLVQGAFSELAAIRKAATDLSRLNVGDHVYNVRDRAPVIAGQDRWNHPDVKAWSDASALMDVIAKEQV